MYQPVTDNHNVGHACDMLAQGGSCSRHRFFSWSLREEMV